MSCVADRQRPKLTIRLIALRALVDEWSLKVLKITLMHCYAFQWDTMLRERCQLDNITVYRGIVIMS